MMKKSNPLTPGQRGHLFHLKDIQVGLVKEEVVLLIRKDKRVVIGH
jgi:hypothetical protein